MTRVVVPFGVATLKLWVPVNGAILFSLGSGLRDAIPDKSLFGH
jgi:hypothetical protein